MMREAFLLSDAEVADYLTRHPDFFHNHLELLEVMQIPHPSGNAISLIAKQLEIFRAKHQEQEQRLNELVVIAHENDASLHRMHQLTLAMLESSSVVELAHNLTMVLAECFLTDFVSIKIIRAGKVSEVFVAPDDPGLQHFAQELQSNQPRCGLPSFTQAQFLFGADAWQVKSCAIVPMLFNGLDGLIAIGSRDEQRFHASMGTLFLSQMSEIVATRLLSILRAAG